MSDHRVVLASAGTGKTFQLTNRFMALLARGIDPSSILATTFTRKAAGEILERVLSRLAAAATEPRALKELQDHVDPGLTHKRCTELVVGLVSSVHRLNIRTLDSFFAWINSCFGLEMGIPPGWRIVSDEEDADMRSRAIQEALRSADREQMVTFLEMLQGGEYGRDVHGAIQRAVRSAYSAWLDTIDHPEAWAQFGPDSEPLSDAALARAITALSGLAMPLTKAGQVNKQWQDAHSKAVAAARAGNWQGFLEAGLAQRVLAGASDYSRVSITDDIILAYRPLIQHARSIRLREFLGRNLATRELMERFHRAYQQAKDETGALRFEDVPRRLLRHPLDGRLHHLYYRLDARLHHILLDEFQDTSLDQFELIEPILDELLSGSEGSVFIVGDEKQSLYSWRAAEPELLPSLKVRWSQLVESTLDLNFRSSPVVLDTVNRVFSGLPANAALTGVPGAAEVWSDRYTPHRAARESRPGVARLVFAPSAGEDASRKEQAQTTVEFAASRIRAILDLQPLASIGVLVRTNSRIAEIIFELQRLGIPASEEGGNPLTDSPPVAVAISLLQLADHPGDTAALYHVATSPIGVIVGLTDPRASTPARRVAAEIRHRLVRDGYAEYLRWLLARAAGAMDARECARFEQLIDLAQEFDQRAGTRPADFVRMVQERGVQDPGRQRVSVMTIHKAKGLEFDVVVLPELDREWKLKSDTILTDRRDADGCRSPFAPITAVTRYPNEKLRALHPGLQELYDHWKERQVGEELCCLYVALTRAVHVLEMIVDPPKARESRAPLSAAGVLRSALAPGIAHAPGPGQPVWEERNADDAAWIEAIEGEHQRSHPVQHDGAPVQVALAEARHIPLGRLRRRSPSSLEGGDTIDLAQVWSAPVDAARDRGSLIHAWFETIEWLDDGLATDGDLLALAPALGLGTDAARSLLGEFKACLRGEVAAVLSRAAYAGRGFDAIEVRREWSFIVRDADPASRREILLSGQFDRVVIGRHSGRAAWAEVLDFKTDRVTRGDVQALETRMQAYRPQVQAYRRALGTLLGLAQQQITARLIFTEVGKAVAID